MNLVNENIIKVSEAINQQKTFEKEFEEKQIKINQEIKSLTENYYLMKIKLKKMQDNFAREENKKTIKEIFAELQTRTNSTVILSIENTKEFLETYYEIIYDFYINLFKSENFMFLILQKIKKEDYIIMTNFITDYAYNFIYNDLDSNYNFINNFIYLLIEDEIKKILNSDIKDYNYFLNDTPLEKIIKNLLYNEKIKMYLNKVLYSIILDIENMDDKSSFIELDKIKMKYSYSHPIFEVSLKLKEIQQNHYTTTYSEAIKVEKQKSNIIGTNKKLYNKIENHLYNDLKHSRLIYKKVR